MKSFGPPARTAPIRREPFEFTFLRDDEPETHTFQARAVTDTAGIVAVLRAAEKNPERALTGMLAMIAKMLDNKDGTPANWEPKPLSPPERLRGDLDGSDPARSDGEWVAPDDIPVRFRAPSGDLLPMAEAARFQEFEAGSSRRRWLHLMNADDEVTVDAEVLTKLFEWLVGLAAGRPTQP